MTPPAIKFGRKDAAVGIRVLTRRRHEVVVQVKEPKRQESGMPLAARRVDVRPPPQPTQLVIWGQAD